MPRRIQKSPVWFGPGGDLLVAGALLVFTLPLIAILALAIKCDSPGPVLCRQARIGAAGRRAVVFGFRTNLERGGASMPMGQLTRIGRVLRYTCMDRLPQLVNVLRGEVALAELFNE